jgi:hypothetical protein
MSARYRSPATLRASALNSPVLGEPSHAVPHGSSHLTEFHPGAVQLVNAFARKNLRVAVSAAVEMRAATESGQNQPGLPG